jgi:hypothetical protein
LAFESHRAPQQSQKSRKSIRKAAQWTHRAIFLRADTKSIGILPIRASAPSAREQASLAEQNESGRAARCRESRQRSLMAGEQDCHTRARPAYSINLRKK